MLETCMALFAIIPVIIGVCALAEYMTALRAVNSVVDQYVSELNTHPHELRDWDVYHLFRARVAELDDVAAQAADDMQAALLKQLPRSSSDYRIELDWRHVPIDTIEGGVFDDENEIALYKNKSGAPEQRGNFSSLSIPGASFQTPYLVDEFDDLVAHAPRGTGQGAWEYAIPAVIKDTAEKQYYDVAWAQFQNFAARNFLRSTALWGARVSVSMQDTLAGFFMTELGIPPVISRRSMVAPRSVF